MIKEPSKNSKKIYTEDEVNIALIETDIKSIKMTVNEIKEKLENDYVTQETFKPIRNLVYGTVSIFLTGVVGALIALVLK